MAVTSVQRDHNTADVMRLHASGVSQRAIASRLGISRPMVQRIIDSADDYPVIGSDSDGVSLSMTSWLSRLELRTRSTVTGTFTRSLRLRTLTGMTCPGTVFLI